MGIVHPDTQRKFIESEYNTRLSALKLDHKQKLQQCSCQDERRQETEHFQSQLQTLENDKQSQLRTLDDAIKSGALF